MLNRIFGSFLPQGGAPANVHVVPAGEVKAWYEAGDAVVIDVREPNEYAAEHIPGATNLPLSTFDPSAVPLPKDKKLVLHCRSGQRCGMAASRLVAAGYGGEINRLEGGIMGWKSVGGRTE